MVLIGGGCRDDAPEQILLELGTDTVRLAPGVAVVDIRVGGGNGEFEPATVTARVGDVIRFTARDSGSHAIVFVESGLEPAARDFLENTGQLRGPPLIEPGTAWVLSLEGAPPGRYPFRCLTHGTSGVLTVAPADPRSSGKGR